jgi:fatty acid synthase subunit alpha
LKVVRENARKLEAYIEEIASGDTISGSFNIQKVQDDVLKLWSIVKSQRGISQEQKNRIKAPYEGVVRSLRKDLDPPRSRVGTKSRRSSPQFLRPQISGVTSVSADKVRLSEKLVRTGSIAAI